LELQISLVQRAYAAASIPLPRTSGAQSRVGTPVPITQLRPGDLVFSAGADGTPTDPGHVAMMIGPGLIIEAPHTGAAVRLARLTPGRLAELVAARRLTR
jgi:cell wall-associated NlpC family hydrolase